VRGGGKPVGPLDVLWTKERSKKKKKEVKGKREQLGHQTRGKRTEKGSGKRSPPNKEEGMKKREK